MTGSVDFKKLLDKNGPTAIIIREKLRPAGGKDSVVFPPTFAGDSDAENSKSGYNIDVFPNGAGNRCTIDTVQSQANRIEEEFLSPPYASLVPQIIIKAGNKSVNLLQSAHRLGDAAIRFSSITNEIDAAFKKFIENSDCSLIAKLSPMSLVFGVWDSRGTFAKIARAFSSQIYASNVVKLTRSSQFIPSFTVEDVKGGLDEASLSENEKKKWSVAGLAHAPAKGPGGVLVNGNILKETSINLTAIRRIRSEKEATTNQIQEYILGLAMVCATLNLDNDLRSGCLLVQDGPEAVSCKQVFRTGAEQDFVLTPDEVMAYAKNSALKFGVEQERIVDFDATKALDYLNEKKKPGKKENK